MTMLRDIALECPICGTWFRSQATDAGTRSPRTVRTTTDFRNSTEAPETLPYLVHQCVGCGFAGGDEEFGVDVPREPWAAAPVDGRELDGSDGDVAGSEKYEAAARVAALRGETPNVVADLMLRAAWCCADAGDREAERWYRREAARG